MNKKKILVTGGAGFVGSHLCERLALEANNEVYSLDNYFTGSKANHVANVTYDELKSEMEAIQQQMVEAKKIEHANALKEVKHLCKEFGVTTVMLKGSLAKGRAAK
jgi:nucleoside-diphosphate-sugar epimerase